MSRGMWGVLAAMVSFAAVVLGVIAWANWSGEAGSQRGLVIHTDLAQPVIVQFEDGRSERLGDGVRERTFVVRREQFPATFRVLDASDQSRVLFEREYRYQELVDAEFRISIDEQGFHHTDDYRDSDVRTPVTTPA